VVTGEASASAIAELTAIAHDAVGTDVVKVLTEFDPSEVAAYGAAAMARWTHRVDETTLVHTGNKVPDHEYWAGEEARRKFQASEHEEL